MGLAPHVAAGIKEVGERMTIYNNTLVPRDGNGGVAKRATVRMTIYNNTLVPDGNGGVAKRATVYNNTLVPDGNGGVAKRGGHERTCPDCGMRVGVRSIECINFITKQGCGFIYPLKTPKSTS